MLETRDIKVTGRPQVSYTCGLNFRAPNVHRCQFYTRLVGGDDDAPVTLGAFWRRPIKIVATVL